MKLYRIGALGAFLLSLVACAQAQISNTGEFIGRLPRFTRSTLPDAASYTDRQVIIVENNGSRSVWYSDGTAWTAPSVSTVALSGITDMTSNARTFNSAASYASMKTLLGLDLVDNTSDATKNAASATLTNKTLTSPTINGGTHTGLTNFALRNAGTGAFDATVTHNGTLTAGRTLTLDLVDGSRTLTLSGSLNIAGGNALTLTTTGSTSLTLPTSGTVATTAQALAETFCVAASDEATALTTGTAKVTFRMPYAMSTVTAVRGSLATAQTSGTVLTFDVKELGTTIFSTKPSFNNTSRTTVGASTPAVLSDTSLADDAEMTVDITQVGDGTAKGLKVCIIGTR